MSNSQRGEVMVSVDGVDYVLRPTCDAIANIEGSLDMGVIGIYQRCRATNIGLRETEAVIREGIRGSGGTPPRELRRLIYQEGVGKYLGAVLDFISNALNGGESPLKKQEIPGEAQPET